MQNQQITEENSESISPKAVSQPSQPQPQPQQQQQTTDKIIAKKDKHVTLLNRLLRKYLKENKQITIFISIIILFRKKKYENVEYYEMYNYLLNSFSKNKNQYILENKKNNTQENNEQIIVNDFLDDIDYELNNNKALNIIINGEEKMIELDLAKAAEYLNKKNTENIDDNHDNTENNNNVILVEEEGNKTTYLKKKTKRVSIPKNEKYKKRFEVERVDDKYINISESQNISSNIIDLTSDEEKTPEIVGKRGRRSKSIMTKRSSNDNENSNEKEKENVNDNTKSSSSQSRIRFHSSRGRGRPRKIDKLKEKQEEKRKEMEIEKEKEKEKVKEKEIEKVENQIEKEIDNDNNNNDNDNEKEDQDEKEDEEQSEINDSSEKEIENEEKEKIIEKPKEKVENESSAKGSDISSEKKSKTEDIIQANNTTVEEESILYQDIPKKTQDFLSKIGQTKLDLESFESKLIDINKKVEELQKNQKSYDDIKKLVDESQLQLSNIYNIMKNGLNSLQIFTGINNYDRNIYNSHKNTISCYKKYYLDVVNKIKDYITDLNKIETSINDNRKDIKESYQSIISLHKQIIGNINVNFEELIQKNNKDKAYNVASIEEILKDFQKKGELLIKEINDIEGSKNINEDTNAKEGEEEKTEEKEESTEPKESTEVKELSPDNKYSVEDKEQTNNS